MSALALLLTAIPQLPHPLLSEHRGPVDEPAGKYDSSNRFRQGLTVGDFDADGAVDLWWWDVHWNQGDGRFERDPLSSIQGPWSFSRSFVTTLDLEGDGDLDVLAGHDLRIYENQGDGTFTSIVLETVYGDEVTFSHATHGDFNGDGVQDFAFAYRSEEYFPANTRTEEAVYVSNGTGGWTKRSLNRALGAMLPVDRDGDGDLDLIGFDRTTNPGQWFEQINVGNGLFGRVPNEPTGLPQGSAYVPHFPRDYDGDGDLDLVVSDVNPFTADLLNSAVWFDDGTGSFLAAPALPANVNLVVGTGDLDGDGFEDLIATGYDESLIGLGNDGTGAFVTLFTLPNVDASWAWLEDVDGDGDGDLIASGTRLHVFQQVAPLVFAEDGASLSHAVPVVHSAVGDVDGDGDPDAYLGDSAMFQGDGSIFVGDGTGFFQRDTARVTGTAGAGGAPAFIDHDGDGDLDLFLGDRNPRLLENDGAGYFAPAPGASFPAIGSDARQVEVADLSGDGAPDLALFLTSGTQRLGFLENQGGGVFVYRESSITSSPIWGFDLGDFDGDGDVDVLAEDELWANVVPWPAAGTVPLTPAEVPAGFTAELLVDLDGDGDLDAATGGAVYRNLGNGSFEPPVAPTTGRALAAGDMDGDGTPDLLTLSSTLGLTWERNDGNASLTFGGSTRYSDGGLRALTFNPLAATNYTNRAPILFDADLDGDADLLWGEGSQSIYTNLSRAFYVHGIAGPGHTLTMSLYGPPGTPYILAFAEQTLERYLRFGRLFLDLSTQVPVTRSSGLGATGRAVVEIPILNVPSLAGLRYVGQALVGGPLRFTNADWFTFLDR